MKYLWIAIASIFLSISVSAETLKISCGSAAEQETCAPYANAWAKAHGHQIEYVTVPANPTERLAVYQQLLSSQYADLDVYMIDVIWPALLEPHALDLKTTLKKNTAQHFDAIIANNTVNGKLVGLPWFTDTGLLYYRKDLLEKYKQSVPKTWQALAQVAGVIQAGERTAGYKDMQGFVWQGKAYEGLTCNALEWVASSGGGHVVEPTGKVSVLNPQAIFALEQARQWIGTISPVGVLTYTEEEARGIWQKGNAVFMRNWPYAYFLSETKTSPIMGKVGVATLPRGNTQGKETGVLGGWQLMVSRYSKQPALATALVSYLTSPEVQKQRALKHSLLPTYPHLYDDVTLKAAYPFLAEVKTTLTQATARPAAVTRKEYNKVSVEFFNAVHAVLSGKSSAEESLAQLDRKLNRLSKRW